MTATMHVATGLSTTGGGTISSTIIRNEGSCLATTGVGTLSMALLESTMTTGAAMGVTGDTRSTPATRTEEYWEIGFTSKVDDKNLFLQLFEPISRVLSKSREEQGAVIQSKILPQLSQAAMIAREDTRHRQLSVLIRELKELTEMDSDNDSADGVNKNLAETTEIDT
jgi:hypothetical protein